MDHRLAAIGVLLAAWLVTPCGAAETVTVSGSVRDSDGPVAGATVRVQGTANATRTGADGSFVLTGLAAGATVAVSAWADGCYCSKLDNVSAPAQGLVLLLRRYQSNDNPGYQWLPPVGANGCASCKQGMTQQWIERDAHSRSAVNPRFLTMYNGTDILGNQSPPTRHRCSRDYGCVPMGPDPTRPYYGPGYKLDFPATTGNCAACHTPGAAIARPYGTDPTAVTGADAFGVHCDFCHKVAGVRLNAASGLPYPNNPGVLSMDIRRPLTDDPERPQLFFGTFDDATGTEVDANLPLLAESRYCAPCHTAAFWGVTIYDSFGEWLASPYADPVSGLTCQQCHMAAPAVVGGAPMTNVAVGQGGIDRDPMTIHSHTFPGASDLDLLRNAVTLSASASLRSGRVEVRVRVTNDRTGHHVPTDSPLRHLILLVRVADDQGARLAQLDGPTLPEWCGVGDPADGYYAGLPGTAFAKVLQELWTGISPTAAYWNPTLLISDNRIAAFSSDESEYGFAAPPGGPVSVEVTLLFRRAFKELADWKKWNDPDIQMASTTVVVDPPPPRRPSRHLGH